MQKLDIYKHFNGNIDGWARVGTIEQKKIMNDSDWALIESFIQNIRLIKNGLASETFEQSTNQKLAENCFNDDTIQELKKMS